LWDNSHRFLPLTEAPAKFKERVFLAPGVEYNGDDENPWIYIKIMVEIIV